jgi:crotonobetainyl-CoA:carnitine CoA-transferase CaiB-like acyl-CoA transferase
MNDPQTQARDMVQRVKHPRLGEIPVLGVPVKFSAMSPGVRRPAPIPGEHTDEVLVECGLGPDAIADLRARRVVL